MHHPSRDLMASHLDGLLDGRIIKELALRVAA
jgi:hypothetical protein